jgi:hypothetical protein
VVCPRTTPDWRFCALSMTLREWNCFRALTLQSACRPLLSSLRNLLLCILLFANDFNKMRKSGCRCICTVQVASLQGLWQYPRWPTQSGTVPLFVEQFHILGTKVELVHFFQFTWLESGTALQKSGAVSEIRVGHGSEIGEIVSIRHSIFAFFVAVVDISAP